MASACFVAGCQHPADTSISPEHSFVDPTEMVKAKSSLLVPILDHLNQQDKGVGARFSRATPVRAEDLVSTAEDYAIGKNDLITISITDLAGPGSESVRQVRVTESGKISLPLIPLVTAAGLTEAQLEQTIVAAYRSANLIANAQVSVTVVQARARTFTISGAVNARGEYTIVRSDFRMLDALALAREVNNPTGIDTIYVFRKNSNDQTTLPAPASQPTTPTGSSTQPADVLQPAPPTTVGSLDPADNVEPTRGPTRSAQRVDSQVNRRMPQIYAVSSAPGDDPVQYVIQDGKPVLVEQTPAFQAAPQTAPPLIPSAGVVASATPVDDSNPGNGDFQFNAPQEPTDQRVIAVPLTKLHAGELKYNIVIRPGDYIFVPDPVLGEYFMGGHVLRVGTYSLTARKITLKEAIISAGMLDQVSIPSRTQIIRRVPNDKEIFAKVDIERVFDGSEPDIFLRPEDQILVGTSAYASFLASIRNGFRITYGFGFLYDRNFYNQPNSTNTPTTPAVPAVP